MLAKILDKVFYTQSNITILRALRNYAVGISGREVSRITGLSPKTCLKNLTSLESIGIVKRIRGGRDHIFNLNRKHFLVEKAILPLLDSEIMFFESIKSEIKLKLFKKCNSVYIFGSVARKEDTTDSDIDVCIVVDKKSKGIKLENAVNELRTKISIKYGNIISPFFITGEEFIKRAKSNKPPVPDIIKDGILIFGNRIK
jgi:predicted nucleotidyltransferase